MVGGWGKEKGESLGFFCDFVLPFTRLKLIN